MIHTLRTAVIGIGNPLMGDDGIGPFLIEELQKRHFSGVDLIDLGTGGIQLVHVLAKYDRVIIIDAAEMGLNPGEHKAFDPKEAISVRFTRGYSLHEWDVMRSIEISKELGEAPERITIFAIQSRSVIMGEGISPEIRMRSDEYLDMLGQLLS